MLLPDASPTVADAAAPPTAAPSYSSSSTYSAATASAPSYKANELELILESKQDSTMSFLVALLLLLLVGLVHDLHAPPPLPHGGRA